MSTGMYSEYVQRCVQYLQILRPHHNANMACLRTDINLLERPLTQLAGDCTRSLQESYIEIA